MEILQPESLRRRLAGIITEMNKKYSIKNNS
jgi:hypothetical protein